MNSPEVANRALNGPLDHSAGGKGAGKALSLHRFVMHNRLEELPDCHDDRTTRSNTPSLTTGSSHSDTMSPSLLCANTFVPSQQRNQLESEIHTFGDVQFPPGIHGLDRANATFQGVQTSHQQAADTTFEDKDWESSESEGDDDEFQDEEDDNDASDQDDIEAMVLAAFGGGDLTLAAHLIPILFKEKYSKSVSEIARKVGPWRFAVTSAAPGAGNSGAGERARNTGGASGSQPSSGGRKRPRTSSSGSFTRNRSDNNAEDNEGSEESAGGGGGGGGGDGGEGISQVDDLTCLLKLACPFHKLNPDKYGIQHGQDVEPGENSKKQGYRVCAGPGFRTIQRLKEHLKRVHSPVQCDRCFETFLGTDRAECMTNLEEHRRQRKPCKNGDVSRRNGISESQWAKLDQLKKGRRKAVSRVELWTSIWKVLFPDVPAPTPWYERQNAFYPPHPPSDASMELAKLFKASLDYKVEGGDICFAEDEKDIMKDRVVKLVVQTFELFRSNHGDKLSTETTSSRPSNPLSSGVGGSATIPSEPVSSRSRNSRQLGPTAPNSIAGQHIPMMMPPQRHQLPRQYNPAWPPMPGSNLVSTTMSSDLASEHSSYPQFVHTDAQNPDYTLYPNWDPSTGQEYAVPGSGYDLPMGQDLISGDWPPGL